MRAGLLSIVVMIAILGGCASQQAMQEISRACNVTGPNGMKCARNHPRFVDLSAEAKRQATYGAMLEDQREKGQITAAQADYLYTEFSAKLEAQEQATSAIRGQAASDALIATGGAMMMGNRPPQYYPSNTSCSAFMGTVNCRHY